MYGYHVIWCIESATLDQAYTREAQWISGIHSQDSSMHATEFHYIILTIVAFFLLEPQHAASY